MREVEVAVVGGGPAGAACAAALVAAGADTLVVDRALFPRLKLCAGWITPQVVAAIGMDVAAYPHRFSTFDPIVAHLKGLTFKLAGPQHSIRRTEFDAWLLERSGAEVLHHTVRSVRRVTGGFELDDVVRCRRLVGAGGTRCPVYRDLFRDRNPRARDLQALTLEHELPFEWSDPRCHLWFSERGLPGYGWYVPKADGFLNLGIGAMAARLRSRGEDIRTHWRRFVTRLERAGLVGGGLALAPGGYSYYLRGGVEVVRAGDAFIVGDAAGLATRDLCEGIGPAVLSGQLAARAITAGAEYSLRTIPAYSADNGLVRALLEWMVVRRGPRLSRPARGSAAAA